jgi:polysaccharide biosynthesis protein PslJ
VIIEPPRSPPPVEGGAARLDVTSFLTLWLVLLYGISAQQVVPGVGAIGSPAMLLALSTFFLWGAGWLLPEAGLGRERHPVRPVLVIYLAFMVLSFAVAMSRPLTELESSGAVRALLTAIAMTGIGLLVADGVRDEHRLNTLLRRVVIGATFISLLGILQFLTGMRLQPSVPGLVWNHEVAGMSVRSIFNRPAATAMHAIEFSVVTASLLPLAIHYALYGETRRRRRNMATAAVVIGFAMPLAISRSGILSVLAGLLVLAAGWSWRRRLNGLLVGLAAVPVMWALVPGLVGTFRGLFGNAAYDPSVQARIARGPIVMAMFRERPWLGLGNGTVSADEYLLLDNQIRSSLLNLGLIGLVVVGLLILGGLWAGFVVARLPGIEPETAHLGQAIIACIAAFSISLYTFDAFYYRILTGTLFLLIGATGVLWRLNHASDRILGHIPPTQPAGDIPRFRNNS